MELAMSVLSFVMAGNPYRSQKARGGVTGTLAVEENWFRGLSR